MVSGGGRVSMGAVGGATDATDAPREAARRTITSKLPILTAFLIALFSAADRDPNCRLTFKGAVC